MQYAIWIALSLGACTIVVSILRLWKPSEGCMKHEITLPGGFSFVGCSIWGVVLLVGVFLFSMGFEAFEKNGADTAIPAQSVSISLFSKAQASEAIPCVSGSAGWVYMGDGDYNAKWWFTPSIGEVTNTSGPIAGELVMRAESERYLRSDPFSSLTGTFLGRIMGVETPAVECVIQENSQIRVVEFEKVGRNRAWAKGQIL